MSHVGIKLLKQVTSGIENVQPANGFEESLKLKENAWIFYGYSIKINYIVILTMSCIY